MIPQYSALSLENVPEDQKQWVEPHVKQLNSFMTSVLSLLDGGFTLSNNSANDLYTVRVVGGKFPVPFKVEPGPPPTGAVIVKAREAKNPERIVTPVACPDVEMLRDQLLIRSIPGLVKGVQYDITLLVLREQPRVAQAGDQVALQVNSAADPSGWTDFPRLLNGWANYGSPSESAAYRRDALGEVTVKGRVNSGSSGSIIAHLPETFRPGSDLLIEATPTTAWTSYTPTWTGSSSNPAIGDGSIAGKWRRVGDSIQGRVKITMGSTTTYGSGTWIIGVPSGVVLDVAKWPSGAIPASATSDVDVIGTAGLLDVGTISHPAFVVTRGTTGVALRAFNAAGTYAHYAGIEVNSTTPFTWANTDQLVASFEFPVVGWSATTSFKIVASTGAIQHVEGPTDSFSIRTSFYAEK